MFLYRRNTKAERAVFVVVMLFLTAIPVAFALTTGPELIVRPFQRLFLETPKYYSTNQDIVGLICGVLTVAAFSCLPWFFWKEAKHIPTLGKL